MTCYCRRVNVKFATCGAGRSEGLEPSSAIRGSKLKLQPLVTYQGDPEAQRAGFQDCMGCGHGHTAEPGMIGNWPSRLVKPKNVRHVFLVGRLVGWFH